MVREEEARLWTSATECLTFVVASELELNSVIRYFLITAADGKTYNARHYNLSAIITVGYTVNSGRTALVVQVGYRLGNCMEKPDYRTNCQKIRPKQQWHRRGSVRGAARAMTAHPQRCCGSDDPESQVAGQTGRAWISCYHRTRQGNGRDQTCQQPRESGRRHARYSYHPQ